MNLSSVYLFIMVKRESNAVPEFFKIQMMFIKEVILIQWEFSMIRSRVEQRNPVAQFIRHKQIKSLATSLCFTTGYFIKTV